MSNLKDDIKTGDLQQIYLIYGDEMYLKQYYKKMLSKIMVAEGDTFNYNYFEGKGIVINEIIGIAETMPFFADNRLIVIENSGFFKKANPDFAEYLLTMPESTRILFVENEVEKRNKMYTTVNKIGCVEVCDKQKEEQVVPWIMELAKRNSKKMNRQTGLHMVRKVGTDMSHLMCEMEKLISYTMKQSEITIQDIDEMCRTQLLERIFVLIEAVADKKQEKALKYYHEFLEAKEEPIPILSRLTTQFRTIYKVKELSGKGYSDSEMGKIIGCDPYVAKKSRQKIKNFTNKQLRDMIEDGIETDEAIKSGRLNDVLGVELYIVKCSMS